MDKFTKVLISLLTVFNMGFTPVNYEDDDNSSETDDILNVVDEGTSQQDIDDTTELQDNSGFDGSDPTFITENNDYSFEDDVVGEGDAAEYSDEDSGDEATSDVEAVGFTIVNPDEWYEFGDEKSGVSVLTPGTAFSEEQILEGLALQVEELETPEELRAFFKDDADLRLYSIDFVYDGEVFEPEDIISVSLPMTNEFTDPYLYYVAEDDLVDMHAQIEDDLIVFSTSHFSNYLLSNSEKLSENDTPIFENDLPVVTIDDLTWYVTAGGSAVGFIGSDSDEQYQELLSYYSDIYDVADDEKKLAFQRVDAGSLYEGAESGLIEAAYDNSDRVKITAAVNDVLYGTTGHSVVIYSYNTSVVKVSTIPTELPEDASLEAAAHIDFSSTYQPSVVTPSRSAMRKAAKRVSSADYPEGYVWNLYAKSQIQPFTAEISGTYKIELWGADGDSDTNWPDTVAAGIGGQGGYTTAEIHLNKGETVYFGLGFRNGFSDKRSWNGGGAGWGLWANYSAGGGGAASMYSADINGSVNSPSTTELSGYVNNKDKVLLVAGGGGGAENYFHVGRYPYPCDDGHCKVAYGGGGGGASGGKGSATLSVTLGNPGTQTSGYAFGQGQDYPTSSYDASTGAGGGGWYGGYAVPNVRYEYKNLEIESGAATKSGETAVTTFDEGKRIATVKYTNEIKKYNKASHADSVVNTID